LDRAGVDRTVHDQIRWVRRTCHHMAFNRYQCKKIGSRLYIV
jgi:hypothetical protein